MSLRTSTQKYGTSDDFVMIDGYERNLELEKKLAEEMEVIVSLEKMGFSSSVPYTWVWANDPHQGWYGKRILDQSDFEKVGRETLIYLDNAKRILDGKIADLNYKCHNYPRDTNFCQHATQMSSKGSEISQAREKIQKDLTLDWRYYDDFGIKNKHRGTPFLKPGESWGTRPDGKPILIRSDSFNILPEVYAEEDPSIYQSDEVVTVTPGQLTWYYVKKPSGICERLNVSQNFVNRMTSQGWVFSLTDICKTDVKCPARVRIINIETNRLQEMGFLIVILLSNILKIHVIE